MNAVGQRFGLTGNDFFSFLTNDVEEQEAMRLARQQEEEKAMFSVSFFIIFVTYVIFFIIKTLFDYYFIRKYRVEKLGEKDKLLGKRSS